MVSPPAPRSTPGRGGAHCGGLQALCPACCLVPAPSTPPRAGAARWHRDSMGAADASNRVQVGQGVQPCRTRPRGSAQRVSLPPCPAAHPRHCHVRRAWLTGGHGSPGTPRRLSSPAPRAADALTDGATRLLGPPRGDTEGAGVPGATTGAGGLTPTPFIGSRYRAVMPSLTPMALGPVCPLGGGVSLLPPHFTAFWAGWSKSLATSSMACRMFLPKRFESCGAAPSPHSSAAPHEQPCSPALSLGHPRRPGTPSGSCAGSTASPQRGGCPMAGGWSAVESGSGPWGPPRSTPSPQP